MNIQFIAQDDIDKTKWNSCVHFAGNGNIFGYKWFLDNVAKDWDGLIENDYESVMPLPYRRNFLKNKQMHQPELLRELGIYSINALSTKRIEAFIQAIPDDFKSPIIRLNEQIKPPEQLDFITNKLTNHQLFLQPTYEELIDKFDRNLLLQLEEAEKMRLFPSNQLKPEKIADFYQKYGQVSRERSANYHAIQRIMWNAMHRGWGSASGVTDKDRNLLAVNFFIYSHGKVLSFCPVESPEGKKQGAMAYLFNATLRSHAGRPMILDFNGQTPKLARAMGGQENFYYEIKKVGLLSRLGV